KTRKPANIKPTVTRPPTISEKNTPNEINEISHTLTRTTNEKTLTLMINRQSDTFKPSFLLAKKINKSIFTRALTTVPSAIALLPHISINMDITAIFMTKTDNTFKIVGRSVSSNAKKKRVIYIFNAKLKMETE